MDSESNASRRIKRAQQLRRQRAKVSGGFGDNNDINDKTLVVGGICTLIGAIFIFGVGIGLAHLCFYMFQPSCVTDQNHHNYNNGLTAAAFAKVTTTTTTTAGTNGASSSSSSLSNKNKPDDALKNTIENPTSSELKKTTIEVKKPTSLFPDSAKFPAQCTTEQFDILKQQLPAEGCEQFQKRAWIFHSCSFASKTLCGNANPHWFYDFIQNDSNINNDEIFRAIIVGCNKGYEAIELLRIASPPSSDTSEYDWTAWQSEFRNVDGSNDKIDESVGCPIAGTASSNTKSSFKKSQVFCIEGYPKTFAQLVKTKKTLGYGDELDLTNMIANYNYDHKSKPFHVSTEDPIGATGLGVSHWAKNCRKHAEQCIDADSNSIDNWIQTKPSLTADNSKAPIHFMSITAEGSDYEILRGTSMNLGRVQYLDFGYHWNWHWGDESLKDLIFRLKKKGFVCYWTGSDGKQIWRITDCWQEHYELRFAASIGCVNSNIPAAEPLLNRMEGMFLETLKRN